jgi:hypothetical protein
MHGAVKVDAKSTAGLRSDVRVVLGHDWVKIAACLDADTCGRARATVAMGTP